MARRMSIQNIQYARERRIHPRPSSGMSYHHFMLSLTGAMPLIGPER